MVASESLVPAHGWNYTRLVTTAAVAGLPAVDALKDIADAYLAQASVATSLLFLSAIFIRLYLLQHDSPTPAPCIWLWSRVTHDRALHLVRLTVERMTLSGRRWPSSTWLPSRYFSRHSRCAPVAFLDDTTMFTLVLCQDSTAWNTC
jgi:hypothetical protein